MLDLRARSWLTERMSEFRVWQHPTIYAEPMQMNRCVKLQASDGFSGEVRNIILSETATRELVASLLAALESPLRGHLCDWHDSETVPCETCGREIEHVPGSVDNRCERCRHLIDNGHALYR